VKGCFYACTGMSVCVVCVVYVCVCLCMYVFVMCTDGSSALHQACCDGNDEAAQLLIHYGADVNIADADGRTALHWACNVDSTQCLQVTYAHLDCCVYTCEWAWM